MTTLASALRAFGLDHDALSATERSAARKLWEHDGSQVGMTGEEILAARALGMVL